MAKLTVHNIKGERTGRSSSRTPSSGITDINQDLFYEVVKAQLASRRAGTHATTRSAVAAAKKIYKQKGTGNARHGNIRAPIFAKGGKVHVPKPATTATGRCGRCAPARSATPSSLFVKEGAEGGRRPAGRRDQDEVRRDRARHARDQGVGRGGRRGDQRVAAALHPQPRQRDLPPAGGVNVYDLLRHDTLVLTQDAARALEKRLSA